MRWVVLLGVALAGWPSAAAANCTPGMHDYVRAWPEDGATGVPTNTHLLVHRYGGASFLAHTPALSLRAATGAPIPLRVVRDLRSGSRGMAQRTLVLRPARPLAPGTRYELTPINAHLGYVTTHAFTTGAGPDTATPMIRSVTAGRFHRLPMGCGPADRIPIAIAATDDGPIWVRIRVARTAADVAAGRFLGEMILPVENGEAELGHEMCIGNWGLEPGQLWHADLEVLDTALHTSGTTHVLTLDAR